MYLFKNNFEITYVRTYPIDNYVFQLLLEVLDNRDPLLYSVSNLYFGSLCQDHKLWNNKTNWTMEGI